VPVTYRYAVTHPQYGVIGSYDRTSDDAGGEVRAAWRLRLTVKILGLVVHRETGDQAEVWRAGRLMSFRSTTVTNGRALSVSGDAEGPRFVVRSPGGVTAAPATVVASDPWLLTRPGAGVVVSIRSGRIDPVSVTGGEPETLQIEGSLVSVRHFHVNAAQPDKWEVWMDRNGVPVKFRSLESGAAIDFTLVSSPPALQTPEPR
jgi:hypothetical protein